MSSKLQQDSVKAVQAWCKKRGLLLRCKPRHVHPRAYVIGHAAPMCLIVAVPWPDSEPQCADFNRRYPLSMVHNFDASLKAGDWCITAYVCQGGAGGIQETVAIPISTVSRSTVSSGTTNQGTAT